MGIIEAKFSLKTIGSPSYYLGNDYNYSEDEKAWVFGSSTHTKEAVRKVESHPVIGGKLHPHRTPLPADCHPEISLSELLDDKMTKIYQILIGLMQWVSVIGRLNIRFAVSSLSRFSTNPRQDHLILALHVMGYMKKYLNHRIVVDINPTKIDYELRNGYFDPNFLDDYKNTEEDLDPNLPEPFGRDLETTMFFDVDHAHDIGARRSITGLIGFGESTPVMWSSRRQGCIPSSTYCAEFITMRNVVEKIISLCYMLRCLGIPVTKPTFTFGDNFGVIQSATIPASELKKKHIVISYHSVREAIAARIIQAAWIQTYGNFSDLCTKA